MKRWQLSSLKVGFSSNGTRGCMKSAVWLKLKRWNTNSYLTYQLSQSLRSNQKYDHPWETMDIISYFSTPFFFLRFSVIFFFVFAKAIWIKILAFSSPNIWLSIENDENAEIQRICFVKCLLIPSYSCLLVCSRDLSCYLSRPDGSHKNTVAT